MHSSALQRVVFVVLLVFLGSSAAQGKAPLTTTYVGQHFEVREHDAPTKYVFNGSTRVAKLTGSLSANQRVQRIRVSAGWNLCSLAVTAPNALQALSASGGQGQVVTAGYKWNSTSGGWDIVASSDTLPAGTVLWLNVTTNCALRAIGSYPGPTPNLRAPPEGAFLPGYGLEVLATTNLPGTVTAWNFDPGKGIWHGQQPAPPVPFTNFPPVVGPGQAFYAQAFPPADLVLPDPALSLRFYHQDHLGSSAVLTDAQGNLVEETANYPFGHPRHHHLPKGIHEPYGFSQKEQDEESSLYYFEARYLASNLGRFTRVDPASLTQPQSLNVYSYCANKPLTHIDPSGMQDQTWVDSWIGKFDEFHAIAEAEQTAEAQSLPADASTTRTVLAGTEAVVEGSLNDIAWGMATSVPRLARQIGNFFDDPSPGNIPIAGPAVKEADKTFAAAMDDPNPVTISAAGGAAGNIVLIIAPLAPKMSPKITPITDPPRVFQVTPQGVALPPSPKYAIPSHYVENPYRAGSYGVIENGKYAEKLRIDPATPPGMKGPEYSHYHKDGKGTHFSPRPGDRDPGFK